MDWLLDDEVAELRTVASEGRDSVKPTWQTILPYELEVRKEAMRRINMCGLIVKEALWQARNSDDLRTRFLVRPLALGGRRQQEEDRPTGEQEPAAQEAAKAARTENTAKSSSEKESSDKERRQQADDEGQDRARRLEVAHEYCEKTKAAYT